MDDEGGCEFGMCKEVSSEEVVEVLSAEGRLLALIMMMYGGGRLMKLMNLVMRSESCLADWKRSLLVPLHKDGDN